jgi:hypothetical protein
MKHFGKLEARLLKMQRHWTACTVSASCVVCRSWFSYVVPHFPRPLISKGQQPCRWLRSGQHDCLSHDGRYICSIRCALCCRGGLQTIVVWLHRIVGVPINKLTSGLATHTMSRMLLRDLSTICISTLPSKSVSCMGKCASPRGHCDKCVFQ